MELWVQSPSAYMKTDCNRDLRNISVDSDSKGRIPVSLHGLLADVKRYSTQHSELNVLTFEIYRFCIAFIMRSNLNDIS